MKKQKPKVKKMPYSKTVLTDKQRSVILDLCFLAICEIRFLCFDGQGKRAGLLADAFHNVIKMAKTGIGSVDYIKTELAYYHSEYGKSADIGRFDYMRYIEQNL